MYFGCFDHFAFFHCDTMEISQSNTIWKSIEQQKHTHTPHTYRSTVSAVKWADNNFTVSVVHMYVALMCLAMVFERIHAFYVTLTFWHSITGDTFRSPNDTSTLAMMIVVAEGEMSWSQWNWRRAETAEACPEAIERWRLVVSLEEKERGKKKKYVKACEWSYQARKGGQRMRTWSG